MKGRDGHGNANQISTSDCEAWREGGKKGGKEEGREGGREGGVEMRKPISFCLPSSGGGEREGGREGGRERGREGGTEEGRTFEETLAEGCVDDRDQDPLSQEPVGKIKKRSVRERLGLPALQPSLPPSIHPAHFNGSLEEGSSSRFFKAGILARRMMPKKTGTTT